MKHEIPDDLLPFVSSSLAAFAEDLRSAAVLAQEHLTSPFACVENVDAERLRLSEQRKLAARLLFLSIQLEPK